MSTTGLRARHRTGCARSCICGVGSTGTRTKERVRSPSIGENCFYRVTGDKSSADEMAEFANLTEKPATPQVTLLTASGCQYWRPEAVIKKKMFVFVVAFP